LDSPGRGDAPERRRGVTVASCRSRRRMAWRLGVEEGAKSGRGGCEVWERRKARRPGVEEGAVAGSGGGRGGRERRWMRLPWRRGTRWPGEEDGALARE
jgi:hypothetical protein